MTCIHCGGTDLPLGRPRKDGSRWPMRYCRTCLGMRGAVLVGGGREARNRARRGCRIRAASHLRVILGPCPCRDCKAPVVFYGGRWVDTDSGHRHWCAA